MISGINFQWHHTIAIIHGDKFCSYDMAPVVKISKKPKSEVGLYLTRFFYASHFILVCTPLTRVCLSFSSFPKGLSRTVC